MDSQSPHNGSRILVPGRPFNAREQQMNKDLRVLRARIEELEHGHHELQVVLWHALRKLEGHRLQVSIADLHKAEKLGDQLGLVSHQAMDEENAYVFHAHDAAEDPPVVTPANDPGGEGPDAAA